MLPAEACRLPQILRMVETHPSGSLYDWFQNQGRQLAVVLRDDFPQRLDVFLVPFRAETALRGRHEIAYRKGRTEQAVHACHRVAYRHGVPRIAVVPRTDGHEVVLLRMAGCKLILYRHLQGHLHGYRPTVGIKNILHVGRYDFQQFLSQFNGRFMGQSPEHHMRHPVELFLHRPVQYRMIVSMHGTPPRRHTINQLRAVGQSQRTALCPLYLVRRQRIRGRSVRMPQVVPVKFVKQFLTIHILLLLYVLCLLIL